MTTALKQKLITVEEYHKMAEVGILTREDRVELLEGRIFYKWQPKLKERLLTREDYYKMAEVGILKPNDKVELLDGKIVYMSPIGSKHAACVMKIDYFLKELLKDQAQVRIQSPIRVGSSSEPEPDISVAKIKKDYYSTQHPTTNEILLLIEVANSSLLIDRQNKLKIYAKGGIQHYIIINLVDNQVEIYADPVDAQYQKQEIYKAGESFLLAPFNHTIKVDEFLIR